MTGILILAQATGAAGGPQQQQGLGGLLSSPLVPMLLVIVVFYVFMFRSKRSQDKQKQDMLGKMKRGDRVQTIGGIIGKVVDPREDRVLVKVDESSNTKIWFSRSAIARVTDEDAKPAK